MKKNKTSKLLLGLVIALFISTTAQTVALVMISQNMGGNTTAPSFNSTVLPDMAGGC